MQQCQESASIFANKIVSDRALGYVEKYFWTISVFPRRVCLVAVTLAPIMNSYTLAWLFFNCLIVLVCFYYGRYCREVV